MATKSKGSLAEAASDLKPPVPVPALLFGTTQQVLDHYCHCGACGARLQLSHVTNFTQNLIHEVSRCLECATSAQIQVYHLQ